MLAKSRTARLSGLMKNVEINSIGMISSSSAFGTPGGMRVRMKYVIPCFLIPTNTKTNHTKMARNAGIAILEVTGKLTSGVTSRRFRNRSQKNIGISSHSYLTDSGPMTSLPTSLRTNSTMVSTTTWNLVGTIRGLRNGTHRKRNVASVARNINNTTLLIPNGRTAGQSNNSLMSDGTSTICASTAGIT